MSQAVCDSGPLTHLWQVDAWHTFGTFERIHLAQQVVEEVQAHVGLARLPALAGCQVQEHSVTAQQLHRTGGQRPENAALQEADLATLALSLDLLPELVLTDDLSLRRAIEAAGLTPMGTVGILLRAYRATLLDAAALDDAIERLFVHSTLYLSPRFKQYVQKIIAEALANDS